MLLGCITQWEFRTQLPELEVWVVCGSSRNTATGADRIKLPKFGGPMSWTLFHRRIEVMAGHNNWTAWEIATCLLYVIQWQAVHVLHCVPTKARYKGIIEAFEGR
jgi:hypothetical protein